MKTEEEIDLLIDKWHAGDGSGVPLHEYLGMSRSEYKLFAENPTEYFSNEFYEKLTQDLKDEMNDLSMKAILPETYLEEYKAEFITDEERLTMETLVEDLYED